MLLFLLCRISHRETFRERGYYDRYSRDRPVIASYLNPRPSRWYH